MSPRDATDFSIYKQLVRGSILGIAGTVRKPQLETEYYVYKITKYSPWAYKELFFLTAINPHDIHFQDFIKRQLKLGCYVLATWVQSVFDNYLIFNIDIQHTTPEGDCYCTTKEEEK